jgi:hypothetical protein
LEGRKDGEAEAAAGVQRCVFEFFIDLLPAQEAVARLLDDWKSESVTCYTQL